jgi:hypothetical protein
VKTGSSLLLLLRLEGGALFVAALVGYAVTGGGWLLFVLLFLAPDLSMAGYLAGPKTGARIYNAAHSTLAPLALLVGGFLGAGDLALHVAAIWLAHIGTDRALGYGLKHPTAFTDTHLGRIGRERNAQFSTNSPG